MQVTERDRKQIEESRQQEIRMMQVSKTYCRQWPYRICS